MVFAKHLAEQCTLKTLYRYLLLLRQRENAFPQRLYCLMLRLIECPVSQRIYQRHQFSRWKAEFACFPAVGAAAQPGSWRDSNPLRSCRRRGGHNQAWYPPSHARAGTAHSAPVPPRSVIWTRRLRQAVTMRKNAPPELST